MWKYLLMSVQQHDANNYLSKAQMYLDDDAQQVKRELRAPNEIKKWTDIAPRAKL